MKSFTDYCKYLCLAALAGVLVAGVPSQGKALDFGFETLVIDDLLASGAATDGVPVCSDVKGTACSPDGSVQKCQSKKGAKLCQTCTNGKWGTAYSGGDCWGKKTSFSEVNGNAVLDRF